MKSLFQHALSPLTPRRQASKWLYLNIFLCYYAPENQHRQKNHLANLFPVTEADPGVSKRLQKGLCTSRTVTWEKVKREHGHTRPERRTRAEARTSAHKRAQASTSAYVGLCNAVLPCPINMCAWCRCRGRLECAHGGFSACHTHTTTREEK